MRGFDYEKGEIFGVFICEAKNLSASRKIQRKLLELEIFELLISSKFEVNFKRIKKGFCDLYREYNFKQILKILVIVFMLILKNH
jgi:hypothetical protein